MEKVTSADFIRKLSFPQIWGFSPKISDLALTGFDNMYVFYKSGYDVCYYGIYNDGKYNDVTHTLTHTGTHSHTHTLIHAHTHTQTHIHIHSHTHTPTHTLTLTHIHTHALTHTLAHADTHTHTHTHRHTHSHTYSHTDVIAIVIITIFAFQPSVDLGLCFSNEYVLPQRGTPGHIFQKCVFWLPQSNEGSRRCSEVFVFEIFAF